MRDGDTLPVKNAILRVSLRSRGLASAKCLRRKRWVEVPLRYVS